MNYKALELKLRQSMESAIEKGWAPNPVHAISLYGMCCVVGSLIVDDVSYGDHRIFGDEDYELVASKRLQVSIDVVKGIWSGFDQRNDRMVGASDAVKKAYAIGARIRRDYCEWTNED